MSWYSRLHMYWRAEVSSTISYFEPVLLATPTKLSTTILIFFLKGAQALQQHTTALSVLPLQAPISWEKTIDLL